MEVRNLVIRIEQCLTLSRSSRCVRGHVGAMLIDPVRNSVIADGFNGTWDGSSPCDSEGCPREKLGLGEERSEVGCEHAEARAIAAAAARGASCQGAWMIVSREPCLSCAKLIRACGVSTVVTIGPPSDPSEGSLYLQTASIRILRMVMSNIHRHARYIRDDPEVGQEDFLDRCWRCPCGAVNLLEDPSCIGCGGERISEEEGS